VEVYDLFPEIVVTLTVFRRAAAAAAPLTPVVTHCALLSWFFCWLLYFKGRWSPSSSDSGSSGNVITDYFWGMELYPRLLGGRLDVKTFTNCRFGMMSWSVLVLTFALVQRELHGAVTDSMCVAVSLMFLYCAKFFLWETGYWSSMDIMHDRAGYMICWGCLTWVPAVYTSPALYLVSHTHSLGPLRTAGLLLCGALAVWVNYESDRQRQAVRAADGKALVWGRPAVVIRACYRTAKGEPCTSLLLCSGWWGVARHFHYVPELLAALLWTLPCGWTALPYFYTLFLTALLVDRAARDDKRCRSKYGEAWVEYCARVPYKMLPYVY
jgi:7-dehydrocholesterol reductase